MLWRGGSHNLSNLLVDLKSVEKWPGHDDLASLLGVMLPSIV